MFTLKQCGDEKLRACASCGEFAIVRWYGRLICYDCWKLRKNQPKGAKPKTRKKTNVTYVDFLK